MQEDDRARVLELYGDIFDEIDNDTSVLQLLVSPTRQAVNLARAYDAKDRGGHLADGPAYLGVIEDLRRQAGSLLPAMPRVNESQISLFNEPEQQVNVYDSFGFDALQEELQDAAEEAQDALSVELPDELSDGVSRYPDEDSAESAVLPPPVPVLPQEEEKKEKTPEEELDEFADSVAAFLADFPVAESGETEKQTPAAPAQEKAPEKDETPPAPVHREAPARQQSAKRDISELVMPDEPIVTEKRPIVGLLILFVVLALPVGLLGTGLLLCVGLFALALAAAAIAGGIYGLVTAFTAFSVFADILLVFGLALAAAAVGLLLFWLFVWLVFGVIPDLVRGLVRLARKLCYKEVTL